MTALSFIVMMESIFAILFILCAAAIIIATGGMHKPKNQEVNKQQGGKFLLCRLY
jgi:hypothetical protein